MFITIVFMLRNPTFQKLVYLTWRFFFSVPYSYHCTHHESTGTRTSVADHVDADPDPSFPFDVDDEWIQIRLFTVSLHGFWILTLMQIQIRLLLFIRIFALMWIQIRLRQNGDPDPQHWLVHNSSLRNSLQNYSTKKFNNVHVSLQSLAIHFLNLRPPPPRNFGPESYSNLFKNSTYKICLNSCKEIH